MSSSANTVTDLVQNSGLIIHLGETGFRNQQRFLDNVWLQQLRAKGTRQIVIDPRFSDTARLYGSKWIPIKPGTDEALMAAISLRLDHRRNI